MVDLCTMDDHGWKYQTTKIQADVQLQEGILNISICISTSVALIALLFRLLINGRFSGYVIFKYLKF